MVKTLKAIYEDGVLKPIEPIEGLADRSQVTITLDTGRPRRPLEGWAGGLSDQDAAAMRRVIDDDLEQVNPDEWK